jgi:hypothetical protein
MKNAKDAKKRIYGRIRKFRIIPNPHSLNRPFNFAYFASKLRAFALAFEE